MHIFLCKKLKKGKLSKPTWFKRLGHPLLNSHTDQATCPFVGEAATSNDEDVKLWEDNTDLLTKSINQLSHLVNLPVIALSSFN